MAFKDKFDRNNKKYKSRKDIHKIVNNAAINFLDQFCGDQKIRTLKEYSNEKD